MPARRSSHAVYDYEYHLVWSPKYRKAVLAGAVGERMDVLLREIAPCYDVSISELEVSADHVHLFCSFPPRFSISEIVMHLKSLSARAIFQEFPVLRRRLWGGAFWESGYYVRAVSDAVTAEVVRRYIQRHRDLIGDGGIDDQLNLFEEPPPEPSS